jgi:hypothetical protein
MKPDRCSSDVAIIKEARLSTNIIPPKEAQRLIKNGFVGLGCISRGFGCRGSGHGCWSREIKQNSPLLKEWSRQCAFVIHSKSTKVYFDLGDWM